MNNIPHELQELANAIEIAGERDTFATAALTGIMAKTASTTMPQSTRQALARLAYQMADEMINERERERPQ